MTPDVPLALVAKYNTKSTQSVPSVRHEQPAKTNAAD